MCIRDRVKPLKIQIEDTVYEGTAAGIMEQLRDLSFDPTEFPDVETYIWFVQNNVIRTTGMDLSLIHISPAEQPPAGLCRPDHRDRAACQGQVRCAGHEHCCHG